MTPAMSQPVLLADLLPAALAALRAPHLSRVDVSRLALVAPEARNASVADHADVQEAPPLGLSQVLARVDAVVRRAA